MVRFKNRYILVETIWANDQQACENATGFNEKAICDQVKKLVEETCGEIGLSKILFSLQVKYCAFGRAVIRVPRDQSKEVLCSLFGKEDWRVTRVSGTIRSVQTHIVRDLRKSLSRQLSQNQISQIRRIDYT